MFGFDEDTSDIVSMDHHGSRKMGCLGLSRDERWALIMTLVCVCDLMFSKTMGRFQEFKI